MVWGGMSERGTTTLSLTRGSINSEKYQDILSEHLKNRQGTLSWWFYPPAGQCDWAHGKGHEKVFFARKDHRFNVACVLSRSQPYRKRVADHEGYSRERNKPRFARLDGKDQRHFGGCRSQLPAVSHSEPAAETWIMYICQWRQNQVLIFW